MKFALLLLLLFPCTTMANQDDDFLAAREAFQKGNATQLEKLSANLTGSPLEPYLTYYQLRLRWDDKDNSAIRQYLARPVDTPIIEQFRNEWLKHVASQQRWYDFATEYLRATNPDAELSCYILQYQQKINAQAGSAEIRNKWFTGSGQPESCATLFETALGQGIISERDIWTRVRLALEANNVSLAKQLAHKLPQQFIPAFAILEQAASDPQRYLSKLKLDKPNEAQRSIVLFALLKMAKQQPDLAFEQWGKVSGFFPESEQYYFFSWLAFHAARAHNPHAVQWYRAAGDAPMNESQLAWRTRAALRALNWHEVWASIAAMSPQQQQDSAWRYWKGRALKALGRPVDAENIFNQLSKEYNFYGQLAAEELGTLPAAGIVTASFQPRKEELDAMQANAGIQRTMALYRMELRVEASREWSWALRKFDDRQLLVAAALANRNGMFDRSISAADRTNALHDFNLRYPAPYRDSLKKNLHDHNLEEAWVYGLMRQESRFVTRAKSNVGAAGLMQVMPATAKWIARKMGLRDYKAALIHDTEVNLKLGTFYMRNVLSSFDDNAAMASAAYNAGPGRARNWRGNIPLEGAIYAETIPFDETRDYVKKVLSNTVYYSKLFGHTALSLKQRLGTIEAKTPDNQKPIPDEK